MNIKLTVEFEASIEKIWDLLVNPELTKQYMYGCEVLSDWQIGSPINWKGKTEEGEDIIYVKGEILKMENGKSVTFSMIDPNSSIADIPENYVNLTYLLNASESGTILEIIQGNFEGVENAQSRYEDSLKGWEMVIPLMKDLIEK